MSETDILVHLKRYNSSFKGIKFITIKEEKLGKNQ